MTGVKMVECASNNRVWIMTWNWVVHIFSRCGGSGSHVEMTFGKRNVRLAEKCNGFWERYGDGICFLMSR